MRRMMVVKKAGAEVEAADYEDEDESGSEAIVRGVEACLRCDN